MKCFCNPILVATLGSCLAIVLAGSASAGSLTLSSHGGAARAKGSLFAGYEKSGGVKKAEARFTVPKIECTPDREGIIVGLEDSTTPDDPDVAAGVFVICQSGSAVYQAVAFAGGEIDIATGVEAGDNIVASVERDGNSFVATVENSTQDTEVSVVGSAGVEKLVFGSGPLFDNSTGKPVGVPDFGSVKLDNKDGGKDLKKAKRVVRKGGGSTQITAGKLKKGEFTLTFKKN